ncbi:uncharacterized protein LOC123778022 isoform X2 [Ursus americanus]|uniref:uncharacterized protein LOC123778022 isoform X2 n=1 Tax=Ursus americanus TaxID=9643 RepID=UPI001E67C6B4|nr:uncharacterized protein LOC123778022 isoform X2 [Ursus americanus]
MSWGGTRVAQNERLVPSSERRVLIHMSMGFMMLALILCLTLLPTMCLSFQPVFRRLTKIDLVFSSLSFSVGFLIVLSLTLFVVNCETLQPRPQVSYLVTTYLVLGGRRLDVVDRSPTRTRSTPWTCPVRSTPQASRNSRTRASQGSDRSQIPADPLHRGHVIRPPCEAPLPKNVPHPSSYGLPFAALFPPTESSSYPRPYSATPSPRCP